MDLHSWAWLFESGLTLIHDEKLTELFISLIKFVFKTDFKLKEKSKLKDKNLFQIIAVASVWLCNENLTWAVSIIYNSLQFSVDVG